MENVFSLCGLEIQIEIDFMLVHLGRLQTRIKCAKCRAVRIPDEIIPSGIQFLCGLQN